MELPIGELKEAVRGLNEGRNIVEFFHYKEWLAVPCLTPEGCTGINKIVSATEDAIVVEVGGQKTFRDPIYECEFDLPENEEYLYSGWAHAIVCNTPYDGEWIGDDWSLRVCDTFQASWVADAFTGEIDIDATAKAIIQKAHEALKPFETVIARTSKALDEVYQHMRGKYEKSIGRAR